MIRLSHAFLGNLFEHYETALFGFLSPFLATLIFPDHDPVSALILTYAIIPLGMLARPLGALVFGYIGDVYDRRQALFFSLAGMALVSACIALTPTYAQAGMLAPLLFCIGRAAQNFFAAGESMGGAIFVLENSSEKKHDILSSLYSASAIGGHLLASLAVYLLSHYQVIDTGWRFLYLGGCITAFFGCMLRRQYTAVLPAVKSPQTYNFWNYRKPFLMIVICAGFAQATYSMALVLMNGFIPLVTSVTKAEVMKINSYLLFFDLCAFPIFGWIASQIRRETLMLFVSLCVTLFSMPLLISIQGASIAQIIGIRLVFVLFGVAFFAPFHAWAQQLIPAQCRYAMISLGYALGSQLLGSPTAAIALWSFQQTGMVSSVAWYWIALGFISSLSIILTMRKKEEPLNEQYN